VIEKYNITTVVEKDSLSWMIMMGAIIILGTIVVLVCFKHMLYASRKDIIDAKNRQNKSKVLEEKYQMQEIAQTDGSVMVKTNDKKVFDEYQQ